MKEYSFTVQDKDTGKRIDIFIANNLILDNEPVSRNLIKKFKDNVKLNGVVTRLSVTVKANDTITFLIPEPEKLSLTPEDVDFGIVFEDNDIIVIDKPPGLVVHPAKGHFNKTLVHGILNKIDDFGDFNNVTRPGIVHRLDKDTSGLIIVAKNIKSHNTLIKMFKNHEIEKTYLAIVSTDKILTGGIIDKPIGRHKVYRKKFTVREDGKEAVTKYKVLKSVNNHSILEIKLETGRTHQIRVHLSSIGAPIVGDVIYSKKYAKYETKGLALVAKKLKFHHPSDCRMIELEAKLPPHYISLLKELGLD